jgi:acyl transferase domain-containing protein/glutamate-1-semialdehyde aminotransferase
MSDVDYQANQEGIAIIGMSGRFPQAASVKQLWRNLREGRDSISHFTPDEVMAEQVLPETVRQPNYVRARAILEDIELFDASFFGVQPLEAQIMDPQQRLLLECAWEALEDSGYDPKAYANPVGVFVGSGFGYYYQNNLSSNPEIVKSFGSFQSLIGNDRDHVATLVSYKLDLKGPSLTVQTACSTSLVAVHLACQSLLNGECSMALAGGSVVALPRKIGYLFQEGGIFSPDGCCRPFDHRAAGTVAGSGVGVVLLKPLSAALADGDSIRAVIKGSAINNDGALKVGYSAPSVEGQVGVIAEAQAMAGVHPDTISYIEAHGTGTSLGDPIEIAALSKAFRAQTSRKQFCAIGSVKSNIGHLDTAAGVVGLIKTVLALENEELPPSLHYEKPNPQIDFEQSPFFVNAQLRRWDRDPDNPRRAGISSFGIGGTNAHVIVEEAPLVASSGTLSMNDWQVLVLSARTANSLGEARQRLAEHIEQHAPQNLADAAYTLQVGRRRFAQRCAIICNDRMEAVAALRGNNPVREVTGSQLSASQGLVFMFPGQGAQYVNMGRSLYEAGGEFRQVIEEFATVVRSRLGFDLLEIIYPQPGNEATSQQQLVETVVAQVALFAVEYALARQFQEWGIKPAAMIGHSLGEYVAACLSGVFSPESAIELVAERGRLMQELPRGIMLAVTLGAEQLREEISAVTNGSAERLWLTAINAPQRTVVGGAETAIVELERHLGTRRIPTRRLATSHAFHTPTVEPVLPAYEQTLKRTVKDELHIPFVSNETGEWAQAEQVRSAQYWLRHMRAPVQFSAGVNTIAAQGNWIWLEMGPGNTLGQLVKQALLQRDKQEQMSAKSRHEVVSSFTQNSEKGLAGVLRSVAQLWTYGAEVNWSKIRDWSFQEALARNAGNGQAAEPRKLRRISLPTYAFDRQSFWIKHHRRFGPNNHQSQAKEVAGIAETTAQTAVGLKKSGNPVETPATAPAIATKLDRLDSIIAGLRTVITEKSGVKSEALETTASFFELGFDSLLLLQISQGIKLKLGVEVPFRLLVEEYPTISALASYLDQILPSGPSQENRQDDASRLHQSSTSCMESGSVSSYSVSTALAEMDDLIRHLSDRNVSANGAGMVAGLAKVLKQQVVTLHAIVNQLQPSSCMNIPTMTAAVDETVRPVNTPDEPAVAQLTSHGATTEPSRFGPWRPVSNRSDGLTPTQQAYLETFIARYTARTRRSKDFTQAHRSVLADTRVSAGFRRLWKEMVYPIVGRRSAGSRIWDEDGNAYIDLTMGFGVNLFGHAPAFITDALQEQLKEGIHIGPQSRLAGEVAELICELTGAERATFCNTGSESVMAALRLARTVTGRSKIALFSGSYHGINDEVLVREKDPNGMLDAMPAALGIPSQKLQDVLVLPYDRAKSLGILQRRMPDLAAVLVEPVQSHRPEVQPKEFLHELRRLTAERGTALIFDEMITGFRIHPGGAQAWFGVKPDLATYGKIVGGGMPIGVVAGNAQFMNAVDGGMWRYGDDSYPAANQTFFAGTFCKHPLAMAAAKAVLTYLKASGPELQQNLNQQTARFSEAIAAVFERLSAPLRIAFFGSLFRFMVSKEFSYADLFVAHLLEKGIFIGDRAGFLSTAHSEEDIETVVKAVEQAIEELQEVGILHGRPLADAKEDHKRHFYPGPAVSCESVFTPDAAHAAASDQFHRAGQNCRKVALTEAQKGLLALMKIGDHALRAYNESLTMKLHGPFDTLLMKAAFQSVVDRHEALRSTFSLENNHQRVYSKLKVDIPVVDVSSLCDKEREQFIAAFLEEEASRSFDFENGPLVNLRVAKLGEQQHLLSIATHHIACDGMSFDFMVTELGALYSASQQAVPCALPPPAQISEYVDWQAQNQNSAALERSRKYWMAQFADGVPLVDLPTDNLRPALQTHAGKLERITLDGALFGELKSRAAEHGCTMFTFLLAAFMMMIHRQSRMRNIIVGTPAAGQSLMGGHNLIGYCINTLPIRSRMNEDQSFADYIKVIRRNVLDAYEHQHYSLYRLVKDLRLVRDPSRHPMISITFNMDRVGPKREIPGLKAEILSNPRVFAAFDLSWNVVETASELQIECVYNSDLFSTARSKNWMDVYALLLERISDASDFAMRDLLATIDKAAHKNRLAREDAFRRNRQEALKSITRQAIRQL